MNYKSFLKRSRRSAKQMKQELVYPAFLGNQAGVIHDDLIPGSGRVYVRVDWGSGLLSQGFLIKALIPPSVPIKVGSHLRIIEKGKDRFELIPPTPDQIITGGGSVADYHPSSNASTVRSGNAIAHLEVKPTNPVSTSVTVSKWTDTTTDTTYRFPGGSIELSSFIPGSGDTCYVGIFLQDDYATLEAFASTSYSEHDVQPTIAEVVQELRTASTAGSFPIWAIPLTGSITEVTQSMIESGEDLRPLINVSGGGGSGTISATPPTTDRAIATWSGEDADTLLDNPDASIDSSGNVTAVSHKASGTGGNGFVEIVTQASFPSSPVSGVRIAPNSGGHLGWREASDTFIRSFLSVLTANRVYTLLDEDTTFLGTTNTQNVSNKTITASSLVATALSLLLGGFKAIFTHSNSADRTYTLPNYNGTLATLAGVENFTNKTLTTPTVGSFVNANHNHADSAGGGLVSVLREHLFPVNGNLTTQTGALRMYNITGRTLTFQKAFIAVATVPTGAAIIVDINKGGTTIFTTQANRPQISASANTGSTTTFDVTTWADGEYLTFDIDQVGSTIAGANLTIHVLTLG